MSSDEDDELARLRAERVAKTGHTSLVRDWHEKLLSICLLVPHTPHAEFYMAVCR